MSLGVDIVIDGKYRIEGRIGEGGMGVVYRARQLNLDRPVAVKVLSRGAATCAEALERFRREALAVARLRHPNIVTVHDFGDAEGVGAYIVLELLEGRPLHAEIARRGRFEPAQAVALARQVCAALRAAHAAGIVHRDLKPSNIFLEEGPQGVAAKVRDFGIAKLRGGDNLAVDRVTAPGAIIGTPAYMSPEQCEGRDLDARSDIYSLGLVLYEMLTGRPPFLARSVPAAIRMHTSEPPVPPGARAPGISPALDAVVLRALAKRCRDRFPSAEEFASALAIAMRAPDAPSAEVVGEPTLEMSLTTGDVSDDGRTLGAPSAGTEPVPDNNLRSDVTRFIGRARELGDLAALLPVARLLTLTGPGGVGKTRLALEVARSALERFGDGVWFVDLSAVKDPGLLAQQVASALALREEPGRAIADTLVEALRARHALVVLDGCEHRVGAAAGLAAALLQRCAALRILATSREALGVAGEVVWSVQPHGVPHDERDAASSEAVALFVDGVRLRDRDFAVDERNAGVVARICRRLDGIPLAVELAAARARVLSLDQILERLDDRFRLLTGGDRTSVPRHQTLRATIDWSYAFLSDDERRLFERVAIFAGGFTLEAAEYVAELADALEPLSRLVDKSLAVADLKSDEARYRMLDTIREYALERLRESGDEAHARERHAAWVLDLAERAHAGIDGAEQGVWMARLEADHDNLRAVMQRAAADGDWATCARLGWALVQFWTTRGYWSEGRDALLPAVRSGDEMPEPLLAGALHTLGSVELYRAEYAAAEAHLERALEIRRRLGDTAATAATMRMLGAVLAGAGKLERAGTVLESCLALYREMGDELRIAWALGGLGLAAMDAGDWERARTRIEESLALFRKGGGARQAATALHNLGDIAYHTGDLGRAEELLGECLGLAIELDNRQLTSVTYLLLGYVATDRGDLVRAGELYAKTLAMSRELGDMPAVAGALEGMASAAVAAGDATRALALLDEAAALREMRGLVPPAGERAAIDRCRCAATALADRGA
jgi:non-specific serine/threonine protein kinase